MFVMRSLRSWHNFKTIRILLQLITNRGKEKNSLRLLCKLHLGWEYKIILKQQLFPQHQETPQILLACILRVSPFFTVHACKCRNPRSQLLSPLNNNRRASNSLFEGTEYCALWFWVRSFFFLFCYQTKDRLPWFQRSVLEMPSTLITRAQGLRKLSRCFFPRCRGSAMNYQELGKKKIYSVGTVDLWITRILVLLHKIQCKKVWLIYYPLKIQRGWVVRTPDSGLGAPEFKSQATLAKGTLYNVGHTRTVSFIQYRRLSVTPFSKVKLLWWFFSQVLEVRYTVWKPQHKS